MPFDTSSDRLVDPFGRRITYLRLSVTDRCDLRCTYCMSERMRFVPKAELLSLEELALLSEDFIRRGVTKLRLTGGEPLVRRDVIQLFDALSRHLDTGALEELTLTTNGTLLRRFARDLAACGVRRVNVSLDTLDPARYRAVTRRGDISKVLAGLDAAQAAGLRVKLNAVASRGAFEAEIDDLIRFAHGRGHGPQPDRGNAAGRDRSKPPRQVPAARQPGRRPLQALDLFARAKEHRRPGALSARR